MIWQKDKEDRTGPGRLIGRIKWGGSRQNGRKMGMAEILGGPFSSSFFCHCHLFCHSSFFHFSAIPLLSAPCGHCELWASISWWFLQVGLCWRHYCIGWRNHWPASFPK